MQSREPIRGQERRPETDGKTPRFITSKEAVTLGGLFRERVVRSAGKVGYRFYNSETEAWDELTWSQMADAAARWQDAFVEEGLVAGDRVAVMMRNCCEWVMFDQAALALGLVTVPVYADDRGGNVAYILRDSGSRVLVVGSQEEWERIEPVLHEMPDVQRIVCVKPEGINVTDERVRGLSEWLPEQAGPLLCSDARSSDLASIVYTSGTTGFPKGVMLSHMNMLSNAEAAALKVELGESDISLSFLPLSHTLERTVGYYFSIMVGGITAYARSTALLAEDLQTIRPQALVSVPRIYERVYAKVMAGLDEKGEKAKRLFDLAVDVGWKRFLYRQGRGSWSFSLLLWPLLERLVARKITSKLGGRLRVAVSGGAALVPDVSRVFIGLGVPILQGYGLTESSPIISCNTPDNNVPESVGRVVDGVEVKIGDNDELLARGPNIMLGYWNNQEASGRIVDDEGWLHSGDKARIDEQGNVYITGRIKEIIVLSNGEKVSPSDMEMAITMDPLIEQVMVVGEQKPYLSAVCILDPVYWQEFASSIGIDPDHPRVLEQPEVENAVLARIAEQVKMFPGYARIVRIHLSLEPWSVENGLMTPTMKLKRAKVMERLAEPVAKLYEGH
ncbi:MAG: long-chain fatty acid--CoA ligase [Candidatus Thiodiazotropha sp.]